MKRLYVLRNYGGATTGGGRIEPGEYAADDPALYGLADYLVENGHAYWLSDSDDALMAVGHHESLGTLTAVGDSESLDALSIRELRALAAERGIDLAGFTRKDDIVAAIEAAG
jgi:hypothetical protein